MNNRQLNDILLEVQKNHACHQKFLQVLEKYYKKTPFDEFFRIFMHKIRVMFQQEIIESNPYVERFLDFCAQFVALITKKTENDDTSDYNNPYHPFLNRIIEETLKFHRLKVVHARYHSCKFITLILKHIGSQIQLNNDICDQIQEAMLERINDPKPSIQIQAILAMVRLQEPLLPDCPVIKAYVASFYDVNAHVRRAALCRVAPNTMTITKIIERVRDVDHSVRLTAFQRCADIGPRLVKIVDRQSILKSGFSESQTVVRKVFIETLLPKWLTHYDRDYLKFIQGLKLDADEEDIETTYNLAMMIMNVFFGKDPIGEIISALPVAEDKLVPVDELTSDIIMYWCILSDYLRDLGDDGEEYLEKILPDFTPFCNYIDSFIKFKTSKPLDEWENMDYQCILNYLLEMAKRYDFSDEVGRRTFNDLIWSVLQNRRFQPKINSKLITIAEKLSTNQESFIRDICSLISEIEKPLVDNPPSPQKLKEKEFLLAQLRVKINILEGDREDAIDKGEYAKLEKICKELNEVKEQVTNLTEENTESAKVRVVRTDSETICHCLDLMIGVLSLVNLKKTYASLRMIYTEFLSPLLTSNVVEINWRVLNCLGLFSIIDKDIAQDNAKIFCIPIATYRAIPNYNKNALITSVNAICDLIRIYGVSIFGEEENSTSGSGSDRNTTRRRLYRNEDMDDVCVVDQNRMSVDFMIEIILDMLDDECDEIRNVAMDAIAKLILNGFSASPLVLSRLILKWYNPLTEKQDVIQQKLGVIIVHYTKTVKGAREVVEKAVLPILTSISNAPKSSPLADIDVDNMLRFLATLTNTSGTTDIVHVHSNLAHTLCNKIASKPNDNCAGYMAKMLLFLEIPPDGASIKELIRQAEFLLEHLTDKWPKKNVGKFIDKLKNQTASELTAIEETVEDGAEESTENVNKRKDLIEVTTPENSAKRRIVEKEVEPLAPLQIVEGTRRSVRTETLLDTSSSASSVDSVRSTRKKSNKKVVKEKENTTPQKEDTLKNVENTNVTRSVSKKIAAGVKNKIGGKKTQEVEKRKKDSRNGNRQEDKKNSQEIKNKHVNNKKSQSNKQTNVKNNKTSSEEDLDQVTTSNKHVEKSSRRNSKRSQEIKKIVSSPNKQKSTNNTTNPHQTRNASKKNSQEEKFSRSSSAPSVGQTNAINGVKTRSTQKEKRGIKRALSANAIQSMVRSDVSSPLRKKNRSKVTQPEKGTKRKEVPKSTSSSDFENSPSRKSPRKPKRKKMDDFVL